MCVNHSFSEVPTIDDNGLERVCVTCGEVRGSELEVPDMPLVPSNVESWNNNVNWGPPTDPRIQSFMLPTFAKGVKCRDKFMDVAMQHKLRTYTDLLGTCERFAIPKQFATEAMSLFLKSTKMTNEGLYAKARPIDSLKAVLLADPRLRNRVDMIEEFESELAMGPQTEEITKADMDDILGFSKNTRGMPSYPRVRGKAGRPRNPPAPLGFKLCLSCRENKPLSEMGKNLSTEDGFHYYCKPCMQKKKQAQTLKMKALAA